MESGRRTTAAELGIELGIFLEAFFAEGTVAEGFTSSRELLLHRCLTFGKLASHRGDTSARLPTNWTGTAGKIAATFNEIVERNHDLDVQAIGNRVLRGCRYELIWQEIGYVLVGEAPG